jgi:hypothetical protein
MMSAIVVHHFGLPNGIDLIIEYLSAFIVGLFVFQALFMLSMYGGNYWLAVCKTFFAETVSMIMVMVGMIPTMVVLMHKLPGADNPYHPVFWGVMSVATMAGMITAYPINSWMVARGLKHGMMSAIPKTEGEEKMNMNTTMGDHMEMPSDMQHSHHASNPPKLQLIAVLFGTYGALSLALLITSLFAPITFTLGG